MFGLPSCIFPALATKYSKRPVSQEMPPGGHVFQPALRDGIRAQFLAWGVVGLASRSEWNRSGVGGGGPGEGPVLRIYICCLLCSKCLPAQSEPGFRPGWKEDRTKVQARPAWPLVSSDT